MPSEDRALIIAIENYPNATGLATSLPGTNKAAADFYYWLRNTKGVPAANILMCCGGSSPSDLPAANQRGTTRADVKKAVVDLVTVGKDKTRQFFAFLSGHGFALEESAFRKLVDTFVASDFNDIHVDGDTFIRLTELSEELWMSLGGVDHFFFVDCCRNKISGSSAQPTGLGLALDRAELGRPTRYTLFSTISGETGQIASGFSDALMSGLKGGGRAKQISHGQFWVIFDRLFAYAKDRLQNIQEVDRTVDGDGAGQILQIPDPGATHCTIQIEDADSNETFEITVLKGGDAWPAETFQGPRKEFDLRPSDDGYQFRITSGGKALIQTDPPTSDFLDLFEPCTVKFQIALAAGAAAAGEELLMLAPEFESVAESFPPTAPPAPPSRVCDSIASHFPTTSEPDGRPGILFSETLGSVTERETSLWLSWIGASRILQPPHTYSKLGPLPLADFANEQQGSSVLYVLAGLDKSDGLKIGLGTTPLWASPRSVPQMDGVYELKLPLIPGVQTMISFSRPGLVVSTFATLALPNRATFVVLAENTDGGLDLRQFLLPICSLYQYLDPAEFDHIRDVKRTLDLVRLLSVGERQFSQRHNLDIDPSQQDWFLLLNGKWLDPVMGLMASFEMIRRGKLKDQQGPLRTVLANMQRFFGLIPDVTSLAQVLGQPVPPSPGVPLLREALMSTKGYQSRLPLPTSFLDYDSMWTSWRGAVEPPQ